MKSGKLLAGSLIVWTILGIALCFISEAGTGLVMILITIGVVSVFGGAISLAAVYNMAVDKRKISKTFLYGSLIAIIILSIVAGVASAINVPIAGGSSGWFLVSVVLDVFAIVISFFNSLS